MSIESICDLARATRYGRSEKAGARGQLGGARRGRVAGSVRNHVYIFCHKSCFSYGLQQYHALLLTLLVTAFRADGTLSCTPNLIRDPRLNRTSTYRQEYKANGTRRAKPYQSTSKAVPSPGLDFRLPPPPGSSTSSDSAPLAAPAPAVTHAAAAARHAPLPLGLLISHRP